MITFLTSFLTPQVRQWLYGVLLVAVPLLIAYGVVDGNTAALWIALGGAVLGHGTATVALAAQRRSSSRTAP